MRTSNRRGSYLEVNGADYRSLCFFNAAAQSNAAKPFATPVVNESLSIGGSTISVEIGSGGLNVSRTQIRLGSKIGLRCNRIHMAAFPFETLM
jgi:hypothetical protein